MPRFLISIGIVLIALSVIGLVFAIVNLALLPSMQEQLLDIMPNANVAVIQAAAQSRDKSYIGVIICVTAFLCGVIVTRQGIRKSRHVNSAT